MSFKERPGVSRPAPSRRLLERTTSPKPSRTNQGHGVDMEPLVRTLHDKTAENYSDKARDAVATIRAALKNNPENKARLLAAGGIDALIQVLYESDPSTVEHAVTALLNMSLTEGVEPLITSSGGIEAIAYVVKTGTSIARENGAAALFTLSSSESNKRKVWEAGVIPSLVHLLEEASTRGKKDAALVLFHLTLLEDCLADVISAGTVRVLVKLLAEGEAGLEEKVMAVVGNLCKHSEGRQAVHKEGGISAMVDVIDGASARAKEDAAVALYQLGTNNQASFQLILEEGAMPALVRLSQNGTSRARAKSKALLELLRGYAKENSGSFKSSGSFSQSFDNAPTTLEEMRDRQH